MKKIISLLIITLLIIAGCGYNPVTMPDISTGTGVGVVKNESKYLQLNPVWQDANGTAFNDPTDMIISIDGYIFVADKNNQRVAVLNKSGESIIEDEFGNDFSILDNIPAYPDTSQIVSPHSLTIDSKLNLFITDTSNVVYVWNQYQNNTRNMAENSNDSMAVSVTYRSTKTSEEIIVTNFAESHAIDEEEYSIVDAEYIYAPHILDSLLAPHPFYIDESGNSPAVFRSVAAAPQGENAIYLTDIANQRIIKVSYLRNGYVKFSSGITLWLFTGQYSTEIASAGTGAGTVNDPTGIYCNDDNLIFYTQTGPEFGFHKITRTSTDPETWASAFTLSANEILDLGRFLNPRDVTTTSDGIFVLNSGENEVQEFDVDGTFLRKAGLREVTVDTTLIDTVFSATDTSYVPRDTIMSVYYNDILNNAKSVAVDDGIVYILNSGNNEILRYQLSDEVDVDPDDL